MALWGFNRESTQVNSGANTVAGIKAGYQPPFVAGGHGAEMAEKRNIIATKNGWVRREVRVMTGVENTTRIIDQEIVAGNPGGGFNYTANTFLGKPDIAQIYVRLNANGFISANSSGANLYIVFNTPIAFPLISNISIIKINEHASLSFPFKLYFLAVFNNKFVDPHLGKEIIKIFIIKFFFC